MWKPFEGLGCSNCKLPFDFSEMEFAVKRGSAPYEYRIVTLAFERPLPTSDDGTLNSTLFKIPGPVYVRCVSCPFPKDFREKLELNVRTQSQEEGEEEALRVILSLDLFRNALPDWVDRVGKRVFGPGWERP